VRRILGGLLLALGRDPGVTLVSVDRWTLAEELWSFGEDELYLAPLQMSDEDMVSVWVRAGKLYLKDQARSAGEAGALAAVAFLEGRPRPLARKRRRARAKCLRFDKTPEQRYDEIRRIGTAGASRKRGVELAPAVTLPDPDPVAGVTSAGPGDGV